MRELSIARLLAIWQAQRWNAAARKLLRINCYAGARMALEAAREYEKAAHGDMSGHNGTGSRAHTSHRTRYLILHQRNQIDKGD